MLSLKCKKRKSDARNRWRRNNEKNGEERIYEKLIKPEVERSGMSERRSGQRRDSEVEREIDKNLHMVCECIYTIYTQIPIHMCRYFNINSQNLI